MKYNLSDNERTLLSAYMDGELSEQEIAAAEQLLSSREEARLYLSEIRAVEHLSTAALAPSAGAAGIPAAKLTGTAIQAAAKKALFSKAATVGTWGIAGTVGIVATAAVGIALSLSSPKEPAGNVVQHTRPSVEKTVARESGPQFLDVDSSNLIVPPITTSDLVAFAVHGTLPIDAGREQFLTLAPKGSESLAVQVHNCAPERIPQNELGVWSAAQASMLDSLRRVIRTSVIQHSNQGIALRADLPALRLNVISTLERAAPTMPADLRERLDRSRSELMACRDVRRSVEAQEGGQGAVRYIEIRSVSGQVDMADADILIAHPVEIVLGFQGEPAFTINEHSLRTLETFVREQPSSPEMFFPQTPAQEQAVVISNPAGVRTVQQPKRPATFNNVFRRVPRLGALLEEEMFEEGMETLPRAEEGADYENFQVRILPPPPALVPEGNGTRPSRQGIMVQQDADTGVAMSPAKRTRMELHRADSLMKSILRNAKEHVKQEESRRMREQEERNGQKKKEGKEESVSSGGN